MTAQTQTETTDTTMAAAFAAAKTNGHAAEKSAKNGSAPKAARPKLVVPPAEQPAPVPTPAVKPAEQPTPTTEPVPAAQRHTGVFIAHSDDRGKQGLVGLAQRRKGTNFDIPGPQVLFDQRTMFVNRGDEIIWESMTPEERARQLLSWEEVKPTEGPRYATELKLVLTPANDKLYFTIRSSGERVGVFDLLAVVQTKAGAESPKSTTTIYSLSDIPEGTPEPIRDELSAYYARFEASNRQRDENAASLRDWLNELGAKFTDNLTGNQGAYAFTIEGIEGVQCIGAKTDVDRTKLWLEKRIMLAMKVKEFTGWLEEEGITYTPEYKDDGKICLIRVTFIPRPIELHPSTAIAKTKEWVKEQKPQGVCHAVKVLLKQLGLTEETEEVLQIGSAATSDNIEGVLQQGSHLIVTSILKEADELDYLEFYTDRKLVPYTMKTDMIELELECANLSEEVRKTIEERVITFHRSVYKHNGGSYKPKSDQTNGTAAK